jgi:hypothetical protein
MWKINNISHMKEGFGVGIPSSSILELVKKVHLHGSFLGKKYTASQNVVLTEEKHDNPWQAQVSTTTAWRTTEKLCPLQYKIGQFRHFKNGDYKRTHFCNWFLWAVHGGSLTQDLTVIIDEA